MSNLLSSFCPKSVLITGCSRGIGLEFVKQFCLLPTPPTYLIATCRNPDNAKELKAVAEKHPNIHVLKLDVTDYASFPNAVDSVKNVIGDNGLNLLLNNAGVFTMASLDDVTPEMMRENYEINCIAPLMVAKSFIPLLQAASLRYSDRPVGTNRAAVVSLTAKTASFSDNGSGGYYPSRCSKVALNMVTKNLSIDLQKDKIAAYVLNPGWVKTDMGGENAMTPLHESVNGMMNVLAGLGEKGTGLFYDFKGNVIPW